MIWPHSFFIPKRTFTWQLRKPMDCIWNYNIGIFFFLLQLLWTQTKYFSGLKCSVDNSIKAERPHHGRSSRDLLCSLWALSSEAPGNRLLEGRSPSALYPCLQPYRYWFTVFKPVLTLFAPSLGLFIATWSQGQRSPKATNWGHTWMF